MAVLVVLWFAYADSLFRVLRYVGPTTTKRVALVCVTRTVTQPMADYFMKNSAAESPGAYQGGDTHRLPEIDGWLQKQYERITGREVNIVKLDMYGLYEISGEVPRPSRATGFSWDGIQENRDFKKFFKNLAEVNRLELSAYDYILFVELVDSSGLQSDFMENLGLLRDNVGYVKMPVHGAYSNDYYIAAVAHYLARMMGATPQLDDHGYPLFPTGFAEPNLPQRYPQTMAELMGCYIPVAAFQVERVGSLDQVVIGPHTAYQLGWISRSAMKNAYLSAKP